MRVLLDSNVWLAILTTDGFCRRMWRGTRGACRFIGSRDVLEEVEEKLLSKFRFSSRHARLMTTFVEHQIEMVAPASRVECCRDSDDNRILAASLDSKCSYLVTGDRDLLVLKKFEDIRIVAPREFFELLSER